MRRATGTLDVAEDVYAGIGIGSGLDVDRCVVPAIASDSPPVTPNLEAIRPSRWVPA